MARDWEAGTYDRLADPMTSWGSVVVDRLRPNEGDLILDAGCGSGRVTEMLLQRHPTVRVVALDGSPSMIAKAGERLGPFGGRVNLVVADLLDSLPVESVDHILSTATFHWVPDHDRLFRNLAAVLGSGGSLEAQCGGAGNTSNLLTVLSELGIDGQGLKVYATPEETRTRLEAAGFDHIETWLQPEPTHINPDDLESYLRVICLGGILESTPEPEGRALVKEVAARLPESTINYVRLNMSARKR